MIWGFAHWPANPCLQFSLLSSPTHVGRTGLDCHVWNPWMYWGIREQVSVQGDPAFEVIFDFLDEVQHKGKLQCHANQRCGAIEIIILFWALYCRGACHNAFTEAVAFPTNLAKYLTDTISFFKRELAFCWIFLSFSNGKAQFSRLETPGTPFLELESAVATSSHISWHLKNFWSWFTTSLESVASTQGDSFGYWSHLVLGMPYLAMFACLFCYFSLEAEALSRKATV